MQIRIRYFASVREALGDGEERDVAAGSTVSDLRELLIGTSARHADALARGKAIRCALNQAMCEESASLTPGCEVAFFPPVTGG